MVNIMWKIPASAAFLSYMRVAGFGTLPEFEHAYLGVQLTLSNSLATKVEVNENDVRFLLNIIVEDRIFYFDTASGNWLVLADKQ